MLAEIRPRIACRTILITALLVALTAHGVLPVHAAPPTQKDGEITPIGYGETVTGQITALYYEALYSFTGQAGDVITITMTATSHTLDAYLALYAMPDSLTPLAEDDDGGGNTNAQIVYRLNYTGSYIIAATRFGGAAGDTAGDYTLTLTTGSVILPTNTPPGTSTPQPTCNGIAYDVVNTITLSDLDAYPESPYWITAIGLGQMAPVLDVTGPEGQTRCSASGENATGMRLDIPDAGTFVAGANNAARLKISGTNTRHSLTIRLGARSGTGGLYALVIEPLALSPASDTDSATLTTAPAGVYLNLGVYVIMPPVPLPVPTPENPALVAPGPTPIPHLNPVLTLLNTGQSCDDIGSGTCPGTEDYALAATLGSGTTYTGQAQSAAIRLDSIGSPLNYLIHSAHAESRGAYALVVSGQALQRTAPTDDSNSTILQPQDGSTFSGETPYTVIEQSELVLEARTPFNDHPLNGEVGDQVDITVAPDSGSRLAPHVMLFTPEGETLLAEANNPARGGAATLTAELPATGQYTIRVARANTPIIPTSEAYTLSIRHYGARSMGVVTPQVDTIDYDVERTGYLTAQVWYNDYTFTGQAQDVIQARMLAPSSATLDPYLRLYDSSGNVLQDDDNTLDGRNANLRFLLPSTGTYTLRATRAGFEFGQSEGPYQLTLQRETLSEPAPGIPALDWALPSRNGEVTLAAGFSPDPFTVSLTAGGSVNASAALNNQCDANPRGFVSNAPDFRLHYSAGRYRLRIFVRAAQDTTLIVNTPDGEWHCTDDTPGTGGFNPLLDLREPPSGQYDIWVGSYALSLGVDATLVITETDEMP